MTGLGGANGRDGDGHTNTNRASKEQPSPREPDDRFADLGLERDAAAIRSHVHRRVARRFRGSLNDHDIENAVSAALESLLNEHRKGPVEDPRAFATTAGVRAAIKLLRESRVTPSDPHGPVVLGEEDRRVSLPDLIDDRARLARLVEAVEQLDEQKLAAFQLRFIEQLPHDEACARLGIKRSAYFERLKAAKAAIEGAVSLTSHSFRRRQRQLLSDYVSGLLTGRARARAERLIAADPQAATVARELRRAHEDAALLLPFVALGTGDGGTAEASISGAVSRASEVVSSWFGRAPASGEITSSAVLTSGGVRGAGVAGVGLVAKAFGGLSATNIVIGCLGGGAVATIACVATGVLPLPGEGTRVPHPAAKPERVKRAPAHATTPARLPQLVEKHPAAPTAQKPEPVESATPGPEPATETAAPPAEPPADSTSTLEPNVAPEVQEFGVAAAGTPVGGAPPDTNQTDGASASAVRQEFGP